MSPEEFKQQYGDIEKTVKSSLNQMSNDDGDEVLINKNSKSFDVIDIEEQTKAEKIKEEINNLSPEAKAVLLTGLFDKKE